MEYDFIAIGDITTDAFIRLKDARVNCDIDDKNCQLCVRFGDKIPYESVTVVKAVGNSPNAAVSARRLGQRTGLITDLGDDQNGKDCIEVLTEEGVSTEFVRTHAGIPTNYHYVLQYEAERTILVRQEVYPYALPSFETDPKWLYLSSMGETSLTFNDELSAYLTAHKNVKLAFQPGTFQIKFGAERLKNIYARTELLICNIQEAQKILKNTSEEPRDLMALLRALGPKQVVLTDGVNGSYASDGTEEWYVPIYPDPEPPVSRTGAGDATASTTAVYLSLGLSLPDALMRGAINSMSVVQHLGAQKGLLNREQIEEYLANAPEHFKARLL